MESAKKQYSIAEFMEEIGDERAELHDGDIVLMAPASVEHSQAQAMLTASVVSYVQKGGDCDAEESVDDNLVIMTEAWTAYGHKTCFVHDVAAFWKSSIEGQKAPLRATPFWVCEILSPSNWMSDTETKRQVLQKHSVPFYWIVDPLRKGISVYKLNAKNEYVIERHISSDLGQVQLAPFAGLTLDLSQIFL